MNTEDELKQIVGKTLVGCGAVPEKELLFLFFMGASLAIRVEGGALIWEVVSETEH